jgi:putative transposase
MRKSKFSDAQMAAAVRSTETGEAVGHVARRYGVSEATLYNWKRRYGGMEVGDIRRIRQLEEETKKLKQLVADLSLDKVMLQDLLSRKW